MATAVAEFWDTHPAPAAGADGALVVASADHKGVPIRRPAAEAALEGHRPKKGSKPNRKQMAPLGAVDPIERYRRTPEEVVEALFRAPKDKPAETNQRPEPPHQRVRARLARSADGRTEPALEAVFGWMGSEIRARDPDNDRPLPCLMEGQGSLWEAANTDLPQDHLVPILDGLPVTPRLWKAAYWLHPEPSPSALDLVRDRVLRILIAVPNWIRYSTRSAGTHL